MKSWFLTRIKKFPRHLRLWLAITSLILPLVGQSVREVELEKSSNLNVWESVTITPDMVSSTGELIVPASGLQQFHRIKVSLVEAPSISNQPPATTYIQEGESVTFTVGSQGEGLTYQWYQGESGDTSQPIQGATSQTYNSGALDSDTSYWVKVSNVAGSTNSETIRAAVGYPPEIVSQPTSLTITSGNTATLMVSATGPAPFTYQWYRGNLGSTAAPVGTNSSTFTTPPLTVTTKYWVKITNAFGEIQSNSVTITVNPSAPTDMALIPQGSFTMGNSMAADTDITAAPTRTVTLDAFYMGKYEVTKAEWDEVRTWGLSNGYTDLAAGSGKASNHPVQTITWYMMVKWCNARSQKEGLTPAYYTNDAQTTIYKTGSVNVTNAQVKWSASGYRLPTEAEWEKAARGGLSGKRFPWGDTISHSQANYYAASGYSYDSSGSVNNYHPTYATGTSPVGAFAANDYGLHDMAGNVWEWCWDWYGTYAAGSQTNPRGTTSGTYRVHRGGGWHFHAGTSRVAGRGAGLDPTNAGGAIGFRVLRSLAP
jgi:formylglycine-generating enzyme required for sulfatase activity